MRAKSLLSVLVILCCGGLAACSGASAKPQAAALLTPEATAPTAPQPAALLPVDDVAAARGMLLAKEEAPRGWTWALDDSPIDDTCEPDASLGKLRTALLQGGYFRASTGGSVEQEVAVYETVEAAAGEFALRDKTMQCVVDEINAGAAEGKVNSIRQATFSPLGAQKVGDEAISYRVQAVLVDNSTRKSAPLFLDILGVRKGRVITYLSSTSVDAPMDSAKMTQIVAPALAKLRGLD